LKTKDKTSWRQIISWVLRETITPEEGIFLFYQEVKSYLLALKRKEYSLR
jgi:hypothetical protein